MGFYRLRRMPRAREHLWGASPPHREQW